MLRTSTRVDARSTELDCDGQSSTSVNRARLRWTERDCDRLSSTEVDSGRRHPGPRRTIGTVTLQCDAMGDADRIAVVVQGVVHGGAVVPECHRPHLPPEPAAELGALTVAVQHVEETIALGLREALDEAGEVRIDEEAVASGVGMGAHHRM